MPAFAEGQFWGVLLSAAMQADKWKADAWQAAAHKVALASPDRAAPLAFELLAQCGKAGVWPAPVAPIYSALANKSIAPLTVPAFNVRGLTFDIVRAIFTRANDLNAAGIMFELAPSEASTGYQSHAQYAALVCAAAASADYQGPVLLQGDHFSLESTDADEEHEVLELSLAAMASGYRQIDLDTAGLAVDGPDAATRQTPNAAATARLLNALVPYAPAGTIFGGEVGEIGGANTTPEELATFIELVRSMAGQHSVAFGKVSVQTGTRHGGMSDASGKSLRMPLDVELARQLADVAQSYGFGGVVQHGASTLQLDQFASLPGCGVVEVHLATNLQDLVFDSPHFPADLRAHMTAAALQAAEGGVQAAERGADTSGNTAAQVFRQQRWSMWGPYKAQLLNLDPEVRTKLAGAVADWAGQLMGAFQLAGRAGEVRALYSREN